MQYTVCVKFQVQERNIKLRQILFAERYIFWIGCTCGRRLVDLQVLYPGRRTYDGENSCLDRWRFIIQSSPWKSTGVATAARDGCTRWMCERHEDLSNNPSYQASLPMDRSKHKQGGRRSKQRPGMHAWVGARLAGCVQSRGRRPWPAAGGLGYSDDG